MKLRLACNGGVEELKEGRALQRTLECDARGKDGCERRR